MTDGLEPMPPKKSSKRSWLAAIVSIVVVGAIVGGGIFAASSSVQDFLSRFQVEDYDDQSGPSTVLLISAGDTGEDVARKMVDADIIKSFDAIYRDMLNVDLVIFPGSYEFPTKLSGSAALQLLMSGSNRILVSTTIPEGLSVAQILPRLSEDLGISISDLEDGIAQEISRIPDDAPSIEGFLFPATYSFDPNPDANEVIKAMVDRMEQELLKYEIPLVDSLPTLTLASMIASEGRFEEDLFKISRVFVNRLDIGMALQSDPTVKYRYEGSLESFQEGLKDTESLFSTYSRPGLPIGPISSPGGLAIEAALRPADGAWLYFVAINLDTGETAFSETLREHEIAAEIYRQWLRDSPDYD